MSEEIQETEKHDREWFGMFIPAVVWNHPELSCTHKCLYAEMHAIGGWQGKCFASNAYLGKSVGVGENRASVMVSDLIKLGLIQVVKFTGRKRWIKTLFDRDCTKADFVKTQRQGLQKEKGSLCENAKIDGKGNREDKKEESADAVLADGKKNPPAEEEPLVLPPGAPSAPPPPRRSEAQQFCDLWLAAFQQVFGDNYALHWDRDCGTVKKFMASSGETKESMMDTARLAWTLSGKDYKWERESSESVTMFCSQFEKIKNALRRSGKTQPKPKFKSYTEEMLAKEAAWK